jgi:branched-chain amino acid transport system permease protein
MSIVLNGVANGVLVFLIASGLTLILGVMRVVNFAHGGFFMLGAYLAYEIQRGNATDPVVFVLVVLAAGAATAVVGLVAERIVFRRLYDLPPITSLLGTYAVLLILEGVVEVLFGTSPKVQQEPGSLSGGVHVVGAIVPTYDFLLIGFGAVTVIALQVLVQRSELGRRIRAVSEDRAMAGMLGINVNRVFALTFATGMVLAGVGGALAAPTLSLTPDLAVDFIIEAFAVVIVGGLGSIPGSLVASVILGLLNAVLVSVAPSLADLSLYFLMAAVLIVRPQGLLGNKDVVSAL